MGPYLSVRLVFLFVTFPLHLLSYSFFSSSMWFIFSLSSLSLPLFFALPSILSFPPFCRLLRPYVLTLLFFIQVVFFFIYFSYFTSFLPSLTPLTSVSFLLFRVFFYRINLLLLPHLYHPFPSYLSMLFSSLNPLFFLLPSTL